MKSDLEIDGLRKLIQEILIEEFSNLIEGVDIDSDRKTVSFNGSHEEGVNTSIGLNPTFNSIDGNEVISIFKRKRVNNVSFDGNPLVYALKGLNGWKFKHPESDIVSLLKQFIRISEKIKPNYDTIITIPSNNALNENFLHRLNKIIRAKYQITDWLFKLGAEFVYENCLNLKQLRADHPFDSTIVLNIIRLAFSDMEEHNDNIFSFKYIKEPGLRKYISKTMYAKDETSIKYAPYINGKDILVLDDTIASGNSISEACKIIMQTFTPKSLTIITLFSKA